jgi:hypothetical protein
MRFLGLQLLRLRGTTILVSCPSNAAADVVALRVLKSDPDCRMLRINARARYAVGVSVVPWRSHVKYLQLQFVCSLSPSPMPSTVLVLAYAFSSVHESYCSHTSHLT